MKTLESKLLNWFESNFVTQPEPKENIIIDHLANRYHRILRLRELARKELAENTKAGHPYDLYKLNQANHLLREITARLNNRPIYTFNFN
jgi:hypothetical protein